jgi:hypothetical protein
MFVCTQNHFLPTYNSKPEAQSLLSLIYHSALQILCVPSTIAAKRQIIQQQNGSKVYLDKAVMEMQSDQGCRHPCFLGDSLCNNGLHDPLRLGARMVVEMMEQVAVQVAVDRTGKEGRRNKAEQDEANHGSRHTSLLQCYTMLQVRECQMPLACFCFYSCGWLDEVGIGWYI